MENIVTLLRSPESVHSENNSNNDSDIN